MNRNILVTFDVFNTRWRWMDPSAMRAQGHLGPHVGDPIQGQPGRRWTKAGLRRAGVRRLEEWLSAMGVAGEVRLVEELPQPAQRCVPLVVRVIKRGRKDQWYGPFKTLVPEPEHAKLFLGRHEALLTAIGITEQGLYSAIPETYHPKPEMAMAG